MMVVTNVRNQTTAQTTILLRLKHRALIQLESKAIAFAVVQHEIPEFPANVRYSHGTLAAAPGFHKELTGGRTPRNEMSEHYFSTGKESKNSHSDWRTGFPKCIAATASRSCWVAIAAS